MQVFIGVSPAGVEWVVYSKDGEAPEVFEHRCTMARKRLAVARAQALVREIEELGARYRGARAKVMRLKGQAARLRAQGKPVHACDVPGYNEASEALTAVRKALRKAEKKAKASI